MTTRPGLRPFSIQQARSPKFGRRKMGARIALTVVGTVALALLTRACSGGGKDVEYGVNLGPDPTSLADVGSAGGGASYQILSTDEIAELSELALEVVVVDVRQSRLNTGDGKYPSAEQIEKLGTTGLDIVTDVVVEIQRTVADKTGKGPGAGEQFTIVVGGGTFYTTLSEAQGRASGIILEVEVATDGGATGSPIHGEGNQPDPDLEEEVAWDGPLFGFEWGWTPSEHMAEGDRLVVLLTPH